MTERSFCTTWGCGEYHYAHGLCKKHYQTEYRKTAQRKPCSIDGCTRTADSGKLCTSHYRRKKDGNIDAPIRPVNQTGCIVDECDGEHYAKGCCRQHYKPPSTASASGGMLKMKYKIDLRDRQLMLDAQGGKCALCFKEPSAGHPLCVDHDHTHCGGPRRGCRQCVRGLLCPTCNTRLGKIDGTGWLERARDYLANPPARSVLTN